MATPPTMVAVRADRYGPPEVLRLYEAPTPTPRADEVRVRIEASAVTASDIYIRSGVVARRLQVPFRLMMGITRPRAKILGLVFAGVVDACGANITRFRPGDEVYGITNFSLGAYAQYVCMPEADSRSHGCLARRPERLSPEESTALGYGGLLALQYLVPDAIRGGERVLVYGASGTSGTLAVQLAKQRGAQVTAVCGPTNLALARSLGADEVLDYTSDDMPRGTYDLVLDSVGPTKSSPLKTACRAAVAPDGRWSSIGDGSLQSVSWRLDLLTAAAQAGSLRPVVGATYPLEEIVEAHRFVETGHKVGGVALTIASRH